MNSKEEVYTLARWDVVPGREADFVAAWSSLAEIFSNLAAPPIWGTLIRSQSEPLVFYSFGPWHRQRDIEAMRADPKAREGFEALAAVCTNMSPGSFDLVKHVRVANGDP